MREPWLFASIRTNDLFGFGRGRQWWGYLIIHYVHISGWVEVYEPGYPGGPVGIPQGDWYFSHLAATGETWVTGIEPKLVSQSDYWLFGSYEYQFAGKKAFTTYWFNFGPILPILTLLCILYWSRSIYLWRKAHRARIRGKCPTCSYDLRAHQPGTKCPECGTPIAPQKSATISP